MKWKVTAGWNIKSWKCHLSNLQCFLLPWKVLQFYEAPCGGLAARCKSLQWFVSSVNWRQIRELVEGENNWRSEEIVSLIYWGSSFLLYERNRTGCTLKENYSVPQKEAQGLVMSFSRLPHKNHASFHTCQGRILRGWDQSTWKSNFLVLCRSNVFQGYEVGSVDLCWVIFFFPHEFESSMQVVLSTLLHK